MRLTGPRAAAKTETSEREFPRSSHSSFISSKYPPEPRVWLPTRVEDGDEKGSCQLAVPGLLGDHASGGQSSGSIDGEESELGSAGSGARGEK